MRDGSARQSFVSSVMVTGIGAEGESRQKKTVRGGRELERYGENGERGRSKEREGQRTCLLIFEARVHQEALQGLQQRVRTCVPRSGQSDVLQQVPSALERGRDDAKSRAILIEMKFISLGCGDGQTNSAHVSSIGIGSPGFFRNTSCLLSVICFLKILPHWT